MAGFLLEVAPREPLLLVMLSCDKVPLPLIFCSLSMHAIFSWSQFSGILVYFVTFSIHGLKILSNISCPPVETRGPVKATVREAWDHETVYFLMQWLITTL